MIYNMQSHFYLPSNKALKYHKRYTFAQEDRQILISYDELSVAAMQVHYTPQDGGQTTSAPPEPALN